MTNTITTARPSTSTRITPARIGLVAGLLAAAAGIGVLILSGVAFPLVPPGLIVLLGGAALTFLRWRWAPVIGLVAAVYIGVGAVLSGVTAHQLFAPANVGELAGSLLQVVALLVAIVAGALAVGQAVRGQD